MGCEITTKMNPMDEIIDNLYLGDFSSANNINKLKELGIKNVLTILEDTYLKYNESDNINHKTIIVYDSVQENIIKHFGECLNFIKGDNKILVHCAAGISRSATVVVAYLMWNKKMTYENALTFVRKKRNIQPNLGFIEQLKLFEKLLLMKKYDINEIKFEQIKWEPRFNFYY